MHSCARELWQECQSISALACWSAQVLRGDAAARRLVDELRAAAEDDPSWTGSWWNRDVEINQSSLNGVFASPALARFGGAVVACPPSIPLSQVIECTGLMRQFNKWGHP